MVSGARLGRRRRETRHRRRGDDVRQPIFYSLGKFIFYVKSAKFRWRAREVWESVIGLCSFDDDCRLAGMSFHPVIIGGADSLKSDVLEERLAPEAAHGDDAARILLRFCEHSRNFGMDIDIVGDTGRLCI